MLPLAACLVVPTALSLAPPPVGFVDVVGSVHALLEWDPDGAGPRGPLLVVGGSFTLASGVAPGNIACLDPGTGAWSILGTGMNNEVRSLAVHNGQLVAGGYFTTAGGLPCPGVAAWTGTTWAPLGAGLTGGSVESLAVSGNGDLVAGGWFSASGTTGLANVARWTGSAWVGMAGGTNGPVYSLKRLANGDVVAGGQFTQAGGVAAPVARWSGGTWSAIGPGLLAGGGHTYDIEQLPGGDIVVGGRHTFTAGGTASCLRWNGSQWQTLAFGNTSVTSLDVVGGEMYLSAHWFALDTCGVTRLTSTGVTFELVGGLFTVPAGQQCWITKLASAAGRLFVGGTFTDVAGTAREGLAGWAGQWREPHTTSCPYEWSDDPGTTISFTTGAPVKRMGTASNGDLIVMGKFTNVGFPQQAAPFVARWDGSWHAVGNPPAPLSPSMGYLDMEVLPNDRILLGSVGSVVVWDGVSWQPAAIAPWTLGWCADIDRFANGDALLAGSFTYVPPGTLMGIGTGLLRLTASGPVALGGAPPVGPPRAMCVLANDHVAVGFDGVAIWNGAAWTTIAGPGAQVSHLGRLTNGRLVAGGTFTSIGGVAANGIAIWDGSTWHALGGGVAGCVSEVEELPNGHLLVAGDFLTASGVIVNHLARWDGVEWRPIGRGLDAKAMCIEPLATGGHAVGGAFGTVVGLGFADHLAVLLDSCPASAEVRGSGCPSSGGANVLTATTLPWVQSTFVATGTGLPSSALVLTLTSFQPLQTPLRLQAQIAQGGPTCWVYVGTEFTGFTVASGGTAQAQIVLPPAPEFAGLTFHHQWIPVATGPTGAITAVTATNSLELTIGIR